MSPTCELRTFEFREPPLIQSDRKTLREDDRNLLQQIMQEGDIDGLTNGRLRESVGVASSKKN